MPVKVREVAVRKLPQVKELIERTEIVRDWLEAAARCECPSLGECPLFDDPARLPQKVPGFQPSTRSRETPRAW